jgi:hypothetical protein
MSNAQHTPGQEVIRSSFDSDGSRLELLFNQTKSRFTIATRWTNLVHIGFDFPSDSCKRLALARASAVFETVCMDGATKQAAQTAKKVAMRLFPNQCVSPAGFEREVMRRAAIAKAKGL